MVAAVTKAVKTTVKAIWEDFTVSYVSQPIDIFLSPTTREFKWLSRPQAFVEVLHNLPDVETHPFLNIYIKLGPGPPEY
jgi:hypothetical protein